MHNMAKSEPILKSTAPSANGRVVDNHERLRNLLQQGHNPFTLATRYTNKDHFYFPGDDHASGNT